MAYYFDSQQVELLNIYLGKRKEVEKEPVFCARFLKYIIESVDFNSLKVEDGYLVVCSDQEYRTYDSCPSWCWDELIKNLKEEIKNLFKCESIVDFRLSHTEEEEPDPLPPMYWGGTDTVYYYKLTVKIKVEK